jgi:predicted RNA-binding Zn ribbon-like protein
MAIESLFQQLGEPRDEPWCLAFSNTVSSRNDPGRDEHLHSLEDIQAWMVKKGLLAEDIALSGEDSRSFDRAIRLREAIFNLGSALAARRSPPGDDLSELNWNVQRAIVAAKICSEAETLMWDLSGLRTSISGAVGLLALSAAGLFTSERADRVRECNNETCGWLFLDLSKNRSRKWCDMSDCGNVAKARRYYAKQQALRVKA